MRPWLALVTAAAGCHLALGFDDLDFDGAAGAGQGAAGQGSGAAGGAAGAAGQAGAAASGTGGACALLALEPPSGQGGAGAAGGGCGEAPGESDGFDDAAATEARWSASFVDGSRAIERCDPGELRITPGASSQYWNNRHRAPYVHQRVCGDFAFIARVRAETTTGGAPAQPFNAAGLLVRDPVAAGETWLMLSLGKHNPQLETGTRVYVTLDGDNTLQLAHTPSASLGGRLMLCRAGGEVSFHRKLDDETEPQLLEPAADYGLGCCIDVGLTAHRYTARESLRGAFDYAELHAVSTVLDCEQLLDRAP